MEKVARHYDKVVLTLIMCLVILFMSTFSPLAESTRAVGVIAPAVIAIIIAGLAAVGITFVTTGSYGSLEEYIESLFLEFAEYNNTTPEQLLKGTQSGTDKLGRILINNRFVVLIQTFGSWVKAKFSLTNNNTIHAVTPGDSVGNLVTYGNTIQIPAGSGFYDEWVFDTGSLSLIVDTNNPSSVYLCVISETLTTVNYSVTRYINSSDAQVWSRSGFVTTNLNGSYEGISISSNLYWATVSTANANDIIQYSNLVINTRQNFADTLNNTDGIDYNNVGIDIVTEGINLPFDDSSYIDGDGAIIDVDSDWGSTFIDVIENEIPDSFSDSKEGEATIEYVTEDEVAESVEDTSEITNLPSGAIPFVPLALPTFKLVSIWHYVQQWISDTAIAAGSLMSIALQSPSPMVNLFYAIACLAIIFGFIKGLAK